MSRLDAAGELLSEMVNIESVTGKEQEILSYLERRIGDGDYAIRRYEIGQGRYNLLASKGSGRPVFCLNAHCDTMPPSGRSVARAVRGNGMIRGLGSCDDKASLTAMLIAFEELSVSELSGRLDLLVSVDEEVASKGVKTCLSGGYAPDYAIVGEPTALAPIVAHSGLIFLDIWTSGEGGHGSSPWRGKSAILEMMDLYKEIDEKVSTFPHHELVGPASTNLGIISGGDATNRIPTECMARVDIRVMPGMSVSSALEGVLNLVKGRGARHRVYKTGDTFESMVGSLVLYTTLEVERSLMGQDLDPIGFRGWTEAEPLRNLADVDAIVLGPGEVGVAHTEDEQVSLEQVLHASRIYAEVAKRVLSGAVR